MHWVGLSCLCPLFCVEGPLLGLHGNIRHKWHVDVSELSTVFLLTVSNHRDFLSSVASGEWQCTTPQSLVKELRV